MIANPKDVAVEVFSGAPDVEDQVCSIRMGKIGFALVVEPVVDTGQIVASSLSARALSRWALDRNAKAVRFDFDLRFER